MIEFLLGFFAVLSLMLYPARVIDPELQPYYNEATAIIEAHCKWYQLPFLGGQYYQFVEKMEDSNIAAFCQRTPIGFKIVVNRDGWSLLTEDERVALLFHEQAHCVLGAQHVDDPKNFMYPSITWIHMSKVRAQLDKLAEDYCK